MRIFSVFFVLAASLVSLDGCAHAGGFTTRVEKERVVVINADAQRFRVEVNHSIHGYEVDCKKSWMLVWGKPLPINPSNPQDTSATLVEVKSGRARAVFGYSKNIYDVQFSADGRRAILHSDQDQFIDLDRAEPVQSSPSVGELPEIAVEKCEAFEGKSFRRYR
jgi:hypothetical protein